MKFSAKESIGGPPIQLGLEKSPELGKMSIISYICVLGYLGTPTWMHLIISLIWIIFDEAMVIQNSLPRKISATRR